MTRSRHRGIADVPKAPNESDTGVATHLMWAYIGTRGVPMYAHATRPTAPHAPSTTPAPQCQSRRTPAGARRNRPLHAAPLLLGEAETAGSRPGGRGEAVLGDVPA